MSALLELAEIACPLCGSPQHKFFLKTIDFAHGVGDEFTLVRCKGCRHVYMNPAPTPDSLAACYPEGYVQHRDQQAEEQAPASNSNASIGSAAVIEEPPRQSQPWYLSAPIRMIPGLRSAYYWLTENKSQCLPPVQPKGRSALEVGCATGDFLQRLNVAGWKAQGLELVQEPVQTARRRGFQVHQGPLEPGTYHEQQFDDVFAWMVVEHLPDPVGTLTEINRIMRPGGWFCFSIPNFGSPERRLFGKYWHGYELPRHLQHYTVSHIKDVLKRTGFSTRRVIHQPSFLFWLGSTGLACKNWFPWCPLGRTLLDWFWNNPPLWTYFVLGPFARLQAALRMSGRLTILAQKEAS